MKIKAKDHGFSYLLSVGVDPKTEKSNKLGKYLTAIQYLSPGGTCPFASPGCLAACLHTAGNPVYLAGKLRARQARTDLYRKDKATYYQLLCQELDAFVRKCKKKGLKPAVRLNGTSDLKWEKVFPELFKKYKNIQFYDYSKRPDRTNLPKNYDITFSRSEENDFSVGMVLARGGRVAVVVGLTPGKLKKNTPADWRGYDAENGDAHDLTFLRPKNCVLLLAAKGDARKDTSGFVDKVAA